MGGEGDRSPGPLAGRPVAGPNRLERQAVMVQVLYMYTVAVMHNGNLNLVQTRPLTIVGLLT